eukprot:CAMPEP_0180804974 /NCGR_PEP_ID=MMETSP1038_2-20121128/61753_1 /TAXON_ID=632150 /ORGANISM="Azadinium spinosum, Strain 3D9" /LENGTH=50 /DNA_ID=CAMNT_0022845465 /DNA_START=720 /DNA_END=869 /DNA_ORIENTATION=+
MTSLLQAVKLLVTAALLPGPSSNDLDFSASATVVAFVQESCDAVSQVLLA